MRKKEFDELSKLIVNKMNDLKLNVHEAVAFSGGIIAIGVGIIEVKGFNCEQSISYFKNYIPEIQENEIVDLCEKLNYTPLLLRSAIAYMESAQIDISS